MSKEKRFMDSSKRENEGTGTRSFPAEDHGMKGEAASGETSRFDEMKIEEVGANEQGKIPARFEQDFSGLTGAEHVFAVNSANSAFKLAAIFCHIHPGDEVIVSAFAGFDAAVPFADLGAKLIWADIDPETWTMDPADFEREITLKTKAVIASHSFGNPCDIARIVDIAHRYGVLVVEDCGGAIGCRINGRHIGTFGDFGCFGMQSGGVFLCQDENTAKHVPGIRSSHKAALVKEENSGFLEGYLEDRWPQGFDADDHQCAFGSVLIKNAAAGAEILAEQERYVRQRLKDVPEISFCKLLPGAENVPVRLVLCYDSRPGGDGREKLVSLLGSRYKIPAQVKDFPLYRVPLFWKKGFGEHDCPAADKWAETSFSVEWQSGMSEKEQDLLCGAISGAVKQLRKKPGKDDFVLLAAQNIAL